MEISMVEILKYNDDDLKDNEIDQVVTRVKAFIVSSKNNMLIGKTDEGYQLLGGYVADDEEYVQALSKAIYNETGIELDKKDSVEPFFEVRYYNKDYKGSGINRLSDMIYFLVKTDKLPNYKKLKLSEKEIAEKLPIEVIRRSMFHKTLKTYIDEEQNPLNKIKTKEILLAFEKMKEIYKF